jgi:hypothetical protein
MPSGSRFAFFNCRYNKTLEKKSRTVAKWTMRGAIAAAAGGIIAGCFVAGPECTGPLVAFAKNTIRINTKRLSIGPAPTYYSNLGKLGKLLSPFHFHIETSRIWVDANWTKTGVDVYKWLVKSLL